MAGSRAERPTHGGAVRFAARDLSKRYMERFGLKMNSLA